MLSRRSILIVTLLIVSTLAYSNAQEAMGEQQLPVSHAQLVRPVAGGIPFPVHDSTLESTGKAGIGKYAYL